MIPLLIALNIELNLLHASENQIEGLSMKTKKLQDQSSIIIKRSMSSMQPQGFLFQKPLPRTNFLISTLKILDLEAMIQILSRLKKNQKIIK